MFVKAFVKIRNHTPPLDVLGRSCLCEMNKFDDMMLHVAKQNPLHRHVVAVDSSFAVFERAWCVSEIYTANDIGLHQHLVIRSRDDLIENETLLRHLRIENMQASRQEDVEEILRRGVEKWGFHGKPVDFFYMENLWLEMHGGVFFPRDFFKRWLANWGMYLRIFHPEIWMGARAMGHVILLFFLFYVETLKANMVSWRFCTKGLCHLAACAFCEKNSQEKFQEDRRYRWL